MTFTEKIKLKEFWINFAKITIPFFIAVVVVFLIMGNSKALFSGNWSVLNEQYFSDGKWQGFFAPKVVMSVLYGLWITNKNMK